MGSRLFADLLFLLGLLLLGAASAAALARALADADRGELAARGPRLDLVLLEQSCLVIAYWSQRAYHAELIELSGFGWFAHYVYFEGQDEPLPAQR